MESRLSLRRIDGLNGLLLITLIILIASLSIGCGGVDVSNTGGSTGGGGGTNTGSVTLSWQAPTTYEDGTLITDLEGFCIYYGEVSRTYDHQVIVTGNTLTHSISGLQLDTTIYFTITAFDSAGRESNFSNEIYATI